LLCRHGWHAAADDSAVFTLLIPALLSLPQQLHASAVTAGVHAHLVFLYFVYLLLPPQFQVVPQHLHLLLILAPQLPRLQLKLLPQLGQLLGLLNL
jgi:hypothetical protein